MTFARYSSTLKSLFVASSDLISLVTNSISSSVKPASTSCFFCSSVNLNSVVFSADSSVAVSDVSSAVVLTVPSCAFVSFAFEE